MTKFAAHAKPTEVSEVSENRIVGTYLLTIGLEVAAFSYVQSWVKFSYDFMMPSGMNGFTSAATTIVICLTVLSWLTAFLALPYRDDYKVVNVCGHNHKQRGAGYDIYDGAIIFATLLSLYLFVIAFIFTVTVVLAVVQLLLS